MKMRNLTVIGPLLIALGCASGTDPGGAPISPVEGACRQVNDQCNECGLDAGVEELLEELVQDVPQLEPFDSCYEGAREGSDPLNGDPGGCLDLYPEGALAWLAVVDAVCRSCPNECCGFCSERWGRLEP